MADERGSSASARPHALLAGGGTGGHVFPGVAVAEELVGRGWRVSWAGRPASLEERLVRGRRLEFHPLAAAPVVGRGPAARVRALVTLARSARSARRLVQGRAVRAVLGTGGYVSAPAVLGARWARLPVVLLEPNARGGAANRWLSRWSQAAALAYESARPDFRCPATVTGVPVRREFFAAGEPGAGPLRVLVLGGSQGALKVNLLMPAVLARLARRFPDLEVVHQVGSHEVATREVYAAHDLGPVRVRLVPFIDDMAGAMRDAHLVVSRAGAVTLAEICAAGRAAVLVPLALAGAHQQENAAALAAAGGAEVVAGNGTDPERLARVLADLLADPARRRRMGAALQRLARPDAAARIADLLESAAGGRG